ncbi:hypothetical protein Bca52824_023464 [Brassica carinata]|uniref:Uncharacterized protein n=1 Tax=Brassica carinata TaxID=52824 RepID=A0A8X8AVP5_BRACI|nr:hypothetical protein Bca52824_023464 [Brassica carinata]
MEFKIFGSRDEYGVYRDEGFARGIDGDAIEFLKTTSKNASKNRGRNLHPALQEHASSFTRRELCKKPTPKTRSTRCSLVYLENAKWEKLSMEKSLEEATSFAKEMNWMFSADQRLLKRVQHLELELEDLRQRRTMARQVQYRSTE